MKKVSIIGAGMVGASAARYISQMDIVDQVYLLDIKAGLAEGKAMDIMQANWLLGNSTEVIGGTNDYVQTADSDVIVITSGVPRKPGMTREELVGVNSGILKDIVTQCHEYSPRAIYIVVSNPVDTLSLYVHDLLVNMGRPDADRTVIGFGGLLDSARLAYYVMVTDHLTNETTFPITNYKDGFVIGGHGDTTMVPVVKQMLIPDKNRSRQRIDLELTDEAIQLAIEETMKGGAILTELLGTSAWEAPAAGIAKVAQAILQDEGCFPCSTYDHKRKIYIGKMCDLDRRGVFQSWLPSISRSIQIKWEEAAEAIKKVNESLPKIQEEG